MSAYDPERIDRISKIMPEFCKVARAGDEVMLGLEGDPNFPYRGSSRPTAIVTGVRHEADGPNVTLRTADGRETQVNQYTIAPKDVFEYTDDSFANVMERERARQMTEMATSRAETPAYRGSEMSAMQEQLQALRTELTKERELTRSFHQTYLAGLKELTNDMCELDPTGKACRFSRTYNIEYDKMRARAESQVYRGVQDGPAMKNAEDEEEDDDESDDDEDSLSETENYVAESDFF